jgi:HD-GYP domain-containing protein (c-di-GMP phosphodiesterase class II)
MRPKIEIEKTHPEPLPSLSQAVRRNYPNFCWTLLLTHHECYDGTGYPQGLVAEEIPLRGRIFAVADTLDAMTSHRPYRRAVPFSAAKAEIVRQSGCQFDPKVVQAFLSVPQWVGEDIRLGAAEDLTAPCMTFAANLAGELPALSSGVVWPCSQTPQA